MTVDLIRMFDLFGVTEPVAVWVGMLLALGLRLAAIPIPDNHAQTLILG